jgi:hypothetical protein
VSSATERRQPAPAVRLDGQSRALDLLWLETLGRITGRAAHEVKGALNGVSVNLEVVRSRAERADAPASAVSRFAESAAQQLDALIRMNEALLLFARPAREPADVGVTLLRLAALLGPSTAAEGGALELDEAVRRRAGETTTTVRGNATRLALAAALLPALEHKGVTTCRLEVGDTIVVAVSSSAGSTLEVPAAITDALAGAGVRLDATPEGCSLTFPRTGASAESKGSNDA